MKLFDLNWKFSYGNDLHASEVDFNDQDWRTIDLPHDWSNDSEIEKTWENQSNSNLSKTGWYRKHFEIPQEWLDKSILIDFEGICKQSEIYVNGISVADLKKNNSSFQVVLNPYLNYKEKNVIAIQVVIPDKTYNTRQTESGIYKHVWLVLRESPVSKN